MLKANNLIGLCKTSLLAVIARSRELTKYANYFFCFYIMYITCLIFVYLGPQTHQLEKHGKRRKSLHSFPTENPSIRIEPLSNDPKSKDFLGFRVINTTTDQELSRFRAKSIVEYRKFMASLGGAGVGLFTQKTDSGDAHVPVEATHGKWDVIHPSEDELYQRQKMFEQHEKHLPEDNSSRPADAPPSYAETVQQLPVGFYFPQDTGVNLPPDVCAQLAFPGQAVPMYDPNAPLPKAFRRPWHDTFRPPNGPPIFYPVSIGYGSEVGLEPGLQALWDPNRNTYFFLDHIRQVTFFEDPRPPPEPKPVVVKQQHAYGDRQREATLLPGICRDASVIEATTRRALSKPHGFNLYACGVHGRHGAAGQTGETGAIGFPGIHEIGSGAKWRTRWPWWPWDRWTERQ